MAVLWTHVCGWKLIDYDFNRHGQGPMIELILRQEHSLDKAFVTAPHCIVDVDIVLLFTGAWLVSLCHAALMLQTRVAATGLPQ